MTLKNKYIMLLLALLLLVSGMPIAQAQVQRPQQAQDSIRALTLRDFHRLILQHHPVASQAALLTEQARQELRMARGTLDPVISSKVYRKEYNGKEYYNLWSNTLRVPTWFGPELIAGYDQTQGQYLNPEASTPERGLSYAGISVPLGQGLFIDERRAIIRQADLMQGIAEADRVKLINKLLLQATKDYWDWLLFFREVQLYQESLELAEFRLRGVRIRVQEGDLAAIDTVEALTAVQDRQVMLQQAQLAYNNTRLMVATHLWGPDQVPLELQESTVPALTGSELTSLPQDSVQQLLVIAKANHPDLRKLSLKGQQLEVEQRFAANKLLPKLNAEYNVLQSDFYLNSDVLERQHMGANYKLGVSFSMPLFLREERGKLQLTKAKQQANSLQLVQAVREVENNVLAAFNEWQALEEQIRLQERMVENAETLRNGETIRFQNGESSLFLVNAREVKLMEAQLKLYALRAKYAKAKTTLYWSAGEISVD
ncbi:TolC family protein [Pontibacter diazotrophicus]|uniref:TolC family protein n=1 Tax=Pontibacter diazotrophicus TaxID=1400979 RepID=A0A3D8LDT4_9BACT|nr:TolC family protein [Pontibacter diazotrophicus]RDV15629.1 TolC family protein [Pontibacter diazotrophicus]